MPVPVGLPVGVPVGLPVGVPVGAAASGLAGSVRWPGAWCVAVRLERGEDQRALLREASSTA